MDDLRRLYAHYSKRGVRFVGQYESWGDASAAARGYADADVLQRAIDAVQEVRSGRAAYERDGVAFLERTYAYPLLANLLKIHLDTQQLSVIDFGGGLASTYFQCLPYLRRIRHLNWAVVEQSHYADWGTRNLADERLVFFDSIELAAEAVRPNVALISGVLQYLPEPYEVVRRLTAIDSIRVVAVDRTPFLANPRADTQLVVQEVPKHVVDSSYPAWLFSRNELLASFSRSGFELSEEWDAIDIPMGGYGRKVVFKGFSLERQ